MQLLRDDLVAVPLPAGPVAETVVDPFGNFDRVESNPLISGNHSVSEPVTVVFDINTLRETKITARQIFHLKDPRRLCG